MKQMKRTIAVILVLMLGITIFAGCGGTKLSGKYNMVSMTSEGEEIVISEYIEQMKALYEEMEMDFDENEMQGYIEFIDGEKCKVAVFGETGEGTYKLDGKNIEVTLDGETMKGTVDGNKITLGDDEATMTFEKK